MRITASTRRGFFVGFGDNPFTGEKSKTLIIGLGFFRINVKFN